MHDARARVERNAVAKWERDEVAGSLNAFWLRHSQRLTILCQVHPAKLPLDQEGAQHRVVEYVQDRDDELREIRNEDVRYETLWVFSREVQDEESVLGQGAEAEMLKAFDTCIPLSMS